MVQVPKLLNEEVIEEVGALAAKFNGKNSPLLQPMLDMAKPEEKTGEAFVTKNVKELQTEQAEAF